MSIARIESFETDDVVVVRVEDADGAVGFGQSGCFAPSVTAEALRHIVVPLALGASTDPGTLTDLIWNRAYKFRGAFLARALCGIETALWDLRGRREGVPVWRLLGGTHARDIGLYLSRRRRDLAPDAEIAAIAEDVAHGGFAGVKIQIGTRLGREREGPRGRDEALIRALREAFPGLRLSADANGGFDAPGAIAIGRRLDEAAYHHFEEPCPLDDLRGTREVTQNVDLHVSGGEMDVDMGKFEALVDGRVVDIVQCDVGYVGGITRARRVAELAGRAGLGFMPHAPNLTMTQIFTLHLLTAIGDGGELHEWRGRLDRKSGTPSLYAPVPEARAGKVRAPGAPGWGIEIDADRLRLAKHEEHRI